MSTTEMACVHNKNHDVSFFFSQESQHEMEIQNEELAGKWVLNAPYLILFIYFRFSFWNEKKSANLWHMSLKSVIRTWKSEESTVITCIYL